MPLLNTYLNFPGNTEEAFKFYKSVFGGDFFMLIRFSEMPFAATMPEADREKIMHISLPIGNTSVLMGTDALESAGHKLTYGNNYSISIHTDTLDEARQLFAGLSEDGNVTVPLDKASWGDYFGMCNDKFGIQWMINHVLAKE